MKNLINKLTSFIATPTKKNFLWMIGGNGVYAACQWGMLIVLSKLGSPEVVGQFALGLAIVSPVVMITNIQLCGVQVTDTKRQYFFSDYVSVRLMSVIVALVIVFAIIYFGRFEHAVFWATAMLVLAKSIESLSDVFYGFFQQNEKMGYIAKSRIIKGIFSVAVLGVVFYFYSSLTLALAALSCAWLFVFVVYDWNIGKKMVATVEGTARVSIVRTSIESFHRRRESLWRIVVLAFPLGIVMGIISLNANIPRYAIEKYLGTKELGFFAALAYTTVAINMFIQALGQAITPRMAKFFAHEDIDAFNRLLKKAIFINLGIGLFGVFVILIGGQMVLTLIYTSEYAVYTNLFLILMISTTLMGVASALGCAMTAARQFRPQVPLFITVLVSTAVFSFLLIPKLKLYGAAVALIISALIQIVGALWIIQRAKRRLKHA